MKHLHTFENYTLNEQSTPVGANWLKTLLQELSAEKKKLGDLQGECQKHMSKEQYKTFIKQNIKLYKEGKLVDDKTNLYDYCVALTAEHGVVDKVTFDKDEKGSLTNISVYEVEV
jgi:hypothetical protein